ncbi:hypothetical protein LNAOJCKE_3794 [Methylorubrum aminovorans]|uniref:Transmembrane protein n=1 Tax=Methylorubrum aminovorans TaxID=269069 RepID=A0ABQ4UHF6_9HYPH|nr:hypothetical protein [Methylorubrum aminovorans]GJE66574.1 hypothetical protein LNAOJCKE_3794 [Methylorubrum aminovorans]GMA74065.1 hypothetical protein GCM10025880_04820 [Methylorubrum aminovorans]
MKCFALAATALSALAATALSALVLALATAEARDFGGHGGYVGGGRSHGVYGHHGYGARFGHAGRVGGYRGGFAGYRHGFAHRGFGDRGGYGYRGYAARGFYGRGYGYGRGVGVGLAGAGIGLGLGLAGGALTGSYGGYAAPAYGYSYGYAPVTTGYAPLYNTGYGLNCVCD